ncbi:LacI family DNA-binding transcriptional regulator [uncultured Bifidobacterium sp.]|uniref:LacI family DNA-binding transcriptional regulator n=1 Tax=uncultured Bifidobacterium sp. TaxID=165187 RepID=UPI0028DBBCA3|nr:LacI family DNA-binding transcriptional regulator [uncultured Bifidobacterium sp.]
MTGMRDVAAKAGVALSTVSLVVNGTGYVSRSAREKVLAAMKELDYVPNELARNLHRNRTDLIGVIVPTIRHPFFATLTAAIQNRLADRGLRTLLCSTTDAEQGEAEYVDMLRRRMMDGIVVASHTDHDVAYWTSIGRPVVAFDRVLGQGIPTVASDHEQGGNLVADLLLGSGARHVVMVGGPRRQFPDAPGVPTSYPTVRYHMTLEERLRKAGVRYDYLEAGEVWDLDGYRTAVTRAFDATPGMDALVSSDIGAALAVQEAFRRGVAVPRDLQIVAYDGTYLSDLSGMHLTAVRQDFAGLAALIATRLQERIDAGDSKDSGAGRRRGSSASGMPGRRIAPAARGIPPLTGVPIDTVPVRLRIGDSTCAPAGGRSDCD